MHASVYESKEKKGTWGVEISNSAEVIVPWSSLEDVNQEHTLRDVLLLMGFDVIGQWSIRNHVSRVQVRSVATNKADK
jgi:hypothetical protein